MAIRWHTKDIPDQAGRTMIVTGANSGLGYESARVLAGKNAHVIMACRSIERGEEARARICAQFPAARLEVMALDLGSLQSAREFAAAFRERFDKLDVLFNNAGLMAPPKGKTVDGFETQFGVNHLGHFALTGHLLDVLLATPGSRVVSLSSTAAWIGRIRFDDLQWDRGYSRYGAYGQSKLANLLFARELQRRLTAANAQTIAVAAQPGFVITDLQNRAVRSSGMTLEGGVYGIAGPLMSQPVEWGVLPQLYAGLAENAEPGGFYSPARFHISGYPRPVRGPRTGLDWEVARRLWEESERLTGVKYLS